MCRHLVYLGPQELLWTLLDDPTHSLQRQSWQPDDMRGGGTINADGFGVGWYVDGKPVRYRRATPIWSDLGFAEVARVTRAGAVLAAVRSATVGMPVTEAASAPFTGEGWLFSHNGRIAGWPASVGPLAEKLPVVDLLTLDAPTDAALLWALVRHRLRAGESGAAALAATVAEVTAAAPGSRLNLLLTDGTRAYATTDGHSLSLHHTPPTQGSQGRLIIASEPFDDDPGWLAIPDRLLVTADSTTYTLEEL
jgi:glutamine amidotransferase